jgi:GNAT superfamily N-acetyltransferase
LIQIRVVSREDEKRARDRLCQAEWGQRLDLDQFVLRERDLRAHAWSRAAMRTWFLEDESGTLASCETFRMRSRLSPGARDGYVYAVASVFTEPSRRGKGHATRLLDEVARSLEAEDARMHGMILYSDVGARIYERGGYVALAARERVLPRDFAAYERPARRVPAEQLLSLWQAEPPGELGPWAIWPSREQLDWHFERERAYARLIGSPRAALSGAVGGAGGLCAWGVDAKEEVLRVLLLLSSDAGEGRALLAAAALTARELGLKETWIWEDSGFASWAAVPEAVLRDRDGELAMIRVSPAAAGAKPEDWRWVPRALWV